MCWWNCAAWPRDLEQVYWGGVSKWCVFPYSLSYKDTVCAVRWLVDEHTSPVSTHHNCWWLTNLTAIIMSGMNSPLIRVSSQLLVTFDTYYSEGKDMPPPFSEPGRIVVGYKPPRACQSTHYWERSCIWLVAAANKGCPGERSGES